ncbi:hypothetical protein DERP_006956 [Dermatophagoides pteronyssinus]|uniref:Uncharacterized protein n=1 Tax=Dermatophagoides pteronyssinus TaxID=6956 RepID=A0ABQ8JTV4_DERPT|nr:hypothetical protein DERP_006956 [Dermatophagoides pteronyssinus]
MLYCRLLKKINFIIHPSNALVLRLPASDPAPGSVKQYDAIFLKLIKLVAILCMVNNAVVETQPCAKASTTIDVSNRLRPEPPSSTGR